MDGELLRWISNFLVNRQQRVIIDGHESGWRAVLSSVPQGTLLGPLLFIIYVNNAPSVVNNTIMTFANDMKIFFGMIIPCSPKDLQDAISMGYQMTITI